MKRDGRLNCDVKGLFVDAANEVVGGVPRGMLLGVPIGTPPVGPVVRWAARHRNLKLYTGSWFPNAEALHKANV